MSIGPYVNFLKVSLSKQAVYFSGVIGIEYKTGKMINDSFESEIGQMFKNLESNLEEAGVRKVDIVKCNVYLSDMNKFEQLNKFYAEFMGDHKPTRACVEVSKLPKNAQVEIDCIAYI